MILKIISGGQTGADQAALDAALKLGLPYDGWIPKGRKTENGFLPEKYHLKETSTSHYSQRTKRNVMDADGTLIISHGELSGGSAYCRAIADKHDKPWLHVDLNQSASFPAALAAKKWILDEYIRTLNVAGPRASKDPLIYRDVLYLIETVYYLLQIEVQPPGFVKGRRGSIQDTEKWPLTVDEAVSLLMERISLKDRTYIANMFESELESLNDTLGRYIRDHFGLWGDNRELMNHCREIGEENEATANIIIKVLWTQLQKTHRLRRIK